MHLHIYIYINPHLKLSLSLCANCANCANDDSAINFGGYLMFRQTTCCLKYLDINWV